MKVNRSFYIALGLVLASVAAWPVLAWQYQMEKTITPGTTVTIHCKAVAEVANDCDMLVVSPNAGCD